MAGASAVFILDAKGKPLISRDYRGEVPMSIADRFARYVLDQDDQQVKPVFDADGYFFCWVQHRDLYLLAVSTHNCNAMLIVTFLYKLIDLLSSYFRTVEEESIRDNFVVTYELLDEIMDDGYPQTTEVKILREYIKNDAHKMSTSSVKPPTAITAAVNWRKEGIRYKKNEIFLDVVEKLNLLVSSTGAVLRSEIIGSLKMRSYLSGMPELKLGLNDKLLFDGKNHASKGQGVELDDVRFHQCVRLARFENDRTISFIPPDGDFELMNYRLNTQVKPLFWVECRVLDAQRSSSHIEYLVKARSHFKARSVANDVEIHVPVPGDVDSPVFKTAIGHVKYAPDTSCMVWSIKQFQGQKDYTMTARFGLPTIQAETRSDFSKRPIDVRFEIPYFTVSGITVRYLKIIEKSGYQALPWVRYITRNGDYQLRIA